MILVSTKALLGSIPADVDRAIRETNCASTSMQRQDCSVVSLVILVSDLETFIFILLDAVPLVSFITNKA